MRGFVREQQKIDAVLEEWNLRTFLAEEGFKNVWSVRRFNEKSPEIYSRILAQAGYFKDATERGDIEDIEKWGASIERGYALAKKIMEDVHNDVECRYLIGEHGDALTIAIGEKRTGGEDFRVTADEVAMLFCTIPALQKLAELLRAFPGASITEIRERTE